MPVPFFSLFFSVIVVSCFLPVLLGILNVFPLRVKYVKKYLLQPNNIDMSLVEMITPLVLATDTFSNSFQPVDFCLVMKIDKILLLTSVSF